ncbi:EpsG family protein [Weissella cibaria]|uniref:EpsG family protein n=1 Tax=Weissella cibaria TaxID=137591 RepID=UPI00189B0CB1|nr:EpsG family protein [Weissella cibaria]
MVGVFYGLVLIELILLLLTPSRQQRVSIVFLVLLAIIFAYVPITVSDNWVYNWYYTHPEVPTKFEPVFNQVMQMATKVGLSYQQFKLVIFTIEMSCMAWGLNILQVDNKRVVLLCYTAIQFFESGVQLRNYLMATVVFVAIAYLWRDKRFDTMYFVMLVGLAAGIQLAAVFFLLLLPMRRLRTRNAQLWFIGVISAGALLIAVPVTRHIYVLIVQAIATRLPVIGPKMLQYALRFEPGMIIILDVAIAVVLLLLFWRLEAIFKQTDNQPLQSSIRLGQQMALLFYSMVPLYLVAYNFDRILIDGLIVVFAIFAQILGQLTQRNKWLLLAIMGLLVGTYSFATYHYGTKYHNTYAPMIHENAMFPDKTYVMKEEWR